MTKIPAVRRVYLEGTYDREGANGRIYTSKLGWRWFAFFGDTVIGEPNGYKTRKEAHVEGLKELNRGTER